MQQPFREQARDEFRKAFGEPETIHVTGGEIYRWILKRKHGTHLYVTIDSPEIPYICHIMISDPSSKAAEPISNMTLRTIAEIHGVIERIRNQWKSPESSHDAQSIGDPGYLKSRANSG